MTYHAAERNWPVLNSHQGLCIIRAEDSLVTHCTASLELLFGLPKQRIVGRMLWEFMPFASTLSGASIPQELTPKLTTYRTFILNSDSTPVPVVVNWSFWGRDKPSSIIINIALIPPDQSITRCQLVVDDAGQIVLPTAEFCKQAALTMEDLQRHDIDSLFPQTNVLPELRSRWSSLTAQGIWTGMVNLRGKTGVDYVCKAHIEQLTPLLPNVTLYTLLLDI